nr:sigma-70 family RNA polymerase sigma factor [Quadrisphaera sp. RL12-1S]
MTTLDDLFAERWTVMVRLAVLLVDDQESAEDVVADAFTSLAGNWHRIDPDRAVGYLHRSVVNGARSALRRRRTARAWSPPALRHGPSAEDVALLNTQHRELIEALSTLPPRQREALVLRYWSHLDEAATAEAMGVSRGTVKSTTSRALVALRRRVGDTPTPTDRSTKGGTR